MPICVLPEETVRLLGSPLVYSTPVAVVKELLDNALDAQATSVEVFVSPNTVDSIEVRDNGHGIQPADFTSLGNRGCTSKLRNFEEIRTVGGNTLGFRGDALACAANLSTLQITTRTAAESTASKLFFAENGGISKVEPVSGPVGTAVKVTDLFARIPVRKQMALKEVSKTTSKIRDLLRSYAFARPQIKLTFRVLNQPKASWSYSPGTHGNIKQAALQAFGTELVSQCIEKSTNTAQDATDTLMSGLVGISKGRQRGSYTIQALLPKPSADPSKISKGAWFSVDFRPLSSSKGTMEALNSAFKTRLKRTLQSADSTITLKNPFIAVNINCPSKSYDPNVEPCKDELLFADSHYLVDAFERLLDEVYPATPPSHIGPERDGGSQLQAKVSSQASESVKPGHQYPRRLSAEHTSVGTPSSIPIPGTNTSVSPRVQGLLCPSRLEPQQPPRSPRMTANDIRSFEQGSQAAAAYRSPPSSGNIERGRIAELQAAAKTHLEHNQRGQTSRSWRVNTSSQDDGCDNRNAINPLPNRRHEEVGRNSEDSIAQPSQDVNPWVIAKFNATRKRQSDVAPHHVQQNTLTQNDSAPTIVEADSSEGRHVIGLRPVVRLDTEGPSGQQVLSSIPVGRLPALRAPRATCPQPMSSATGGNSEAPESARRQISSRRGPQGSTASRRQEDGNFRQPGGSNHRQSVRDNHENNWFQGSLDFTGRKIKRHQRGRPDATDSSNVGCAGQTVSSQEEPDVGLDLGAIRRRQILAENRILRRPLSGWLDTSEDAESTGMVVPSAEAPVQPPRVGPGVFQGEVAATAGLSAGDPRAYLGRKEGVLPANGPRKLRRVKSCMLPLETTPAGEETHNLMQTAHVEIQAIREAFDRYHGQYLDEDAVDDALSCRIDQSDLREVFHRVAELLSDLGFGGPDNGCEAEFNVLEGEKGKAGE